MTGRQGDRESEAIVVSSFKNPEAALNIPWAGVDQWRQVNQQYVLLIETYTGQLEPLQAIADSITADLSALDPIMEALCAKTCSHCPDPCCIGAKIWYDFNDLLYLHLAGEPISASQLICTRDQICPGWTPTGCRILRQRRPWICTWYLCPAQTAQIEHPEHTTRMLISSHSANIKTNRRQMEEHFIRMLTSV